MATDLETAAAEASAILRAMYCDPWAYRGYPSIERLREAFDKIKAALDGVGVAPKDERAEFEAWKRRQDAKCPSGRYSPSAWEAWEARSAIGGVQEVDRG